MNENNPQSMFTLQGKTVVITGGAGVLGTEISQGVAQAGARLAILELHRERAQALATQIKDAGGQALAIHCDVLDKASIIAAAEKVQNEYGSVDILINGAGGNKPQATTSSDLSFFDLPADAVEWVFNLNFLGTLLPSQVFSQQMAERQEGVILNISSMSAFRALTRVPAYSAAKAAISNFTQWLAVHLAQEYSPNIRVNAIAPGFFLTEQNRFLLTEQETGALTARGKSILAHTPMNRFGVPHDLLGTVLWLVSPASSFVTGVVVPIDGGFAAFSGV